MKKMLTAILISLAVGFVGGFIFANQTPADTGTYDLDVISHEVSEISELATLENGYTLEVPYTSDTRKLWHTDVEIPFSQKSMVVQYDGVIRMGVNLSGFSSDSIVLSSNGRSMTVTIPHSEVISHEIDEDSWELKDKKNGLFNSLKPEDDAKVRKYAKKKALEELDIDALLLQADEAAVQHIKAFLEAACPGVDIKIVFKGEEDNASADVSEEADDKQDQEQTSDDQQEQTSDDQQEQTSDDQQEQTSEEDQ